jgi:hypothetical protein
VSSKEATFVILEPSAIGVDGHFYPYMNNLIKYLLEQQIQVSGYANKLCLGSSPHIYPYFRFGYFRMLKSNDLQEWLYKKYWQGQYPKILCPGVLRKLLNFKFFTLYLNEAITLVKYWEFKKLLKQIYSDSANIIIATSGFREIRIFSKLSKIFAHTNFHLILRDFPKETNFAEISELTKFKQNKESNIHYYSDTQELCYSWANMLGVTIKFVGVATQENKCSSLIKEENIGFVGNIRLDKGSSQIAEVAELILTENSSAKLYFQSNSILPENLAKYSGRIENLPIGLSEEKYLEYLSKIGISPLLYNPEDYKARSSGIFFELLESGAIPIVPTGTSMSATLYEAFFEMSEEYDLKELFQSKIEGDFQFQIETIDLPECDTYLLSLNSASSFTALEIDTSGKYGRRKHTITESNRDELRVGLLFDREEKVLDLRILNQLSNSEIVVNVYCACNVGSVPVIYESVSEIPHLIKEIKHDFSRNQEVIAKIWETKKSSNSFHHLAKAITN